MFTADDIAALKRAIAMGALAVEYPDQSKVTYRSLREMREILRLMTDDVAGSTGDAVSRSFVAGF